MIRMERPHEKKRGPLHRAQAALVVLATFLCLGCPETKRPTVPRDVPVQGGQPAPLSQGGDTFGTPAPDLPTTPDEAIELKLSSAFQYEVPSSEEKTELWFSLPTPKHPMSVQLGVSGGPDTRWGVEIYEGDASGAAGLRTHQPEPGHPFRISGIRAAPNLPRRWIKVQRIWQRQGLKMSTLRVFAEAALIRPGEEAEPNDNRSSSAPEIPRKGRLEGSLSHPGDKDCVSIPQPPEPPEPSAAEDIEGEAQPAPTCFAAIFHFEGPARRPFLVEGESADGRVISARTLRSPKEVEMLPTEPDFPVRVCMKMDDGARAPQRWWAEIEPAPCPVIEAPPEPVEEPDRSFTVSPGQPTVISGKLASQDAEHGLIITAGDTPALVRVEGAVSAVWDNSEHQQLLLPPGANGRLLIRIDSPPEEGDAPFPYWVQLKALEPGQVLNPTDVAVDLSGKRIYSSIVHPQAAELKLGDENVKHWWGEHLGERNSPPLKIKLLDEQSRPVTSRTIAPGKTVALNLPAGFGPYTAHISSTGASPRPVAYTLYPEAPVAPQPPEAKP